MTEIEVHTLHELKQKVEQHEKTIVQLLEIIAATNSRITELSAELYIKS